MQNRKEPSYKKFPLKKETDINQVSLERDRFLGAILEVFLLGGFINYLSSLIFQYFNSGPEILRSNFIYQVIFAVIVSLLLLAGIVRFLVYKPIELRTNFTSSILVNISRKASTPLLFFDNKTKSRTHPQNLLFQLESQVNTFHPTDVELLGQAVQYSVLVWYHHTFANGWLARPKLKSIGIISNPGVENAPSMNLSVPDGIRFRAANSILTAVDNLRKTGQSVTGNAGLPEFISVPAGMTLTLDREPFGSARAKDETRYFKLIFEDKQTCTIKILIARPSESTAEGKEEVVAEYLDLPSEASAWRFYNFEITVDISLSRNIKFRHNWLKHRPHIEHYYDWARWLIHKMERDFCWPLPYRDQIINWDE